MDSINYYARFKTQLHHSINGGAIGVPTLHFLHRNGAGVPSTVFHELEGPFFNPRKRLLFRLFQGIRIVGWHKHDAAVCCVVFYLMFAELLRHARNVVVGGGVAF